MSEEHPNCQAVDRFLTAIPSVNRPICHTQNVDEKPVANGYVASWHDGTKNEGFTVLAMNDGEMLLSIEKRGASEILRGTTADAEAFAAKINSVFFP